MENLDFIHIGFQKTATTWLQKNNYFHPDIQILNVGKNSRLFWDLIEDPGFFFDKFEYIQKFKDIIRSEKIKAFYGLSWERLSGDMLNGHDSKSIADKLYSLFGRVKIIIIIRNQLDMIISTYSQYIKMGGTCSLSRFLEDRDIAGSPFMKRLKYKDLINYYRQLFGPKNVYVDCFEGIKTDSRNFIIKLFQFLNLDSSKIINEHKLLSKENKGFSPISLFLKKRINRFFYLPYNKTPIASLPYSMHQWLRYKVMEKRLDKLFHKFTPSKSWNNLKLSPQKQNELTSYYHDSNKWL
ncbi:MAG: sulfotransferase domain-containing protein, partial [Candidatus Hodarchaeota archaeon]